MQTIELKIPKDIDIKFHRLTSPLFNTLNIPLSGLYNPIDNKESEIYSLNNKFRNFDISSNNCVNIENLLGINTQFGKILTNEKLEGLLTLANNSDHDVTIKDLKIIIKSDDKNKEKEKIKEQVFDIELPNNSVTIHPSRGYTIKIQTTLKYTSKYIIEVLYHARSNTYDQYYFKVRQRNVIKDNSDNYSITGGVVEYFYNKKLNFNQNNPFNINEYFHNSEINNCFIEIHIFNSTVYNLTIYDLYLTPKNNEKEKIQIYKNFDKIKNIPNDSKYLMIQSDEQINILFKIDDPEIFYNVDKFVLHILWVKDFDFILKKFMYEFNNNLNTYNDYYKMTVIEKPKEDIIINQNFKVVINLKTKKPKQKYMIKLEQETIKDNDITNDREIEIIDIIEKKMELNSKTPSNNFILICKSDVLGNAYLPRLKFSLYEGDKNNPIENIYHELLSFNCISKDNDTINENEINEKEINENEINEKEKNENEKNENVINKKEINENEINENEINENEIKENEIKENENNENEINENEINENKKTENKINENEINEKEINENEMSK